MSTKQDIAELFLKCFEKNSSSLITRERIRECYPNARKWTHFMLTDDNNLLQSTLEELQTKCSDLKNSCIERERLHKIDIYLEDQGQILLPVEVENKTSGLIQNEVSKLVSLSQEHPFKMIVLITYDSNETIRKTNRVGQWRYNFLNELSHFFKLNGGLSCPFLLILGNLPIDMDTLNDNNREFHYVNWWCFLKRPDYEKWEEKHFISPKH